MASSSLMDREPSTRKGRRVQEDRSSKLVENVKTAMFIKGPSTSQYVSDVMTEFVREFSASLKVLLRNSCFDDPHFDG